MPKTPIDYSTTIIYKLVKNDDYDNANVYVGSTTDFINRKHNHKNCCNNEKKKEHNQKKYQYIRNNGGWDEWNMVEIEKHPCNDGNEARAREEYWRSHFNAQLNTKRAYRTEEQDKETRKEYRETNKEKTSVYHKERYEQNKDDITIKNKIYYEDNKDDISIKNKIYREKNKDKYEEYNKEYYENNKDKLAEKNNKYYEDNKDIINEKTTCECGCIIRRKNLQRHLKSQRHLNAINTS